MEKDKIIIKLYEILNKEKIGDIVIGKNKDSDFEDGVEQGRQIENSFYKREINNLIKDIKN